MINLLLKCETNIIASINLNTENIISGIQKTKKRSFAVNKPWYGTVIKEKIDAVIDTIYTNNALLIFPK